MQQDKPPAPRAIGTMRGSSLNKVWVGVGPFLVALAVLMNGASDAWAPPAEGVPNMVVLGPKCVVYGGKIAIGGSGFAPGSTVSLSAPEGHYTGPPQPSTVIREVAVQANASGGFTASLKAPRPPKGLPWKWQARVVFATGTAEIGEAEGRSFDQLLIGTNKVCQTLEQQHGRPQRR
jgi:hypothetical protein